MDKNQLLNKGNDKAINPDVCVIDDFTIIDIISAWFLLLELKLKFCTKIILIICSIF